MLRFEAMYQCIQGLANDDDDDDEDRDLLEKGKEGIDIMNFFFFLM